MDIVGVVGVSNEMREHPLRWIFLVMRQAEEMVRAIL